MTIKILQGDCIDKLKTIADKTFYTCVTSPPYWGLRDYGEDDQLGLEETPQKYVANMVQVFREVKRVLRDDGTVWLNLGDSYSSGGRTTTTNQTVRGDKDYGVTRPAVCKDIKPKDLVGIPWRVAFALQEDGWYLRQDIIWNKPNPMPESVKDRCTKSHEYIFLLSKSKNYYFDNESIKIKAINPNILYKSYKSGKNISEQKFNETKVGRNSILVGEKVQKRSVWTVTIKPYKESHFATYPPDLIEPCILAGCPDKVCKSCGTPYEKIYDSKKIKRNELDPKDSRYRPNNYEGAYKDINGKGDAGYNITNFVGYKQQCNCTTKETEGGHVLDPFGGAGTTALVADRLGRNATLIELNKSYIDIINNRLKADNSLFMEIVNDN